MSAPKKESWIRLPKGLITSIAYLHLPAGAHMFCRMLEREHLIHGGAENGRLVLPYDQMLKAPGGWFRSEHAISRAKRQAVAFGLVEITSRGGRMHGHKRAPSFYRLTYVEPAKGYGPKPTHEWRNITTTEQAQKILKDCEKSNQPRPAPRIRIVK